MVRAPEVVPPPQRSAGAGIKSLYDKIISAGGAAAAPSSTPAVAKESEPEPRTSEFETRLYEIKNADLKAMAEEIRQYFFRNGYESQMFPQDKTWIVQGRKTGWLKWISMTEAGTVIIDPPEEDKLRVLIGGGGWLERGAAWANSLYLKPDWVNNALGVDEQKKLIEALWQTAETFLTNHGGKRVE